MLPRIHSGKLKHSLATQFAGAILLLSLFVGIIIFVLSHFLMYSHDQRELKIMMDRVHLSIEPTLITGLWLTNDDVVTGVLDGLITIPEIEQVTIRRNDGKTLELGNITSNRTFQHRHPLSYEYRDQSIPLGSITITVGNDLPIGRMWSTWKLMVVPILILAILGAAFSFFLFYVVIARHLREVANYSAAISLESLDTPLILKRVQNDERNDEIDLISSALESMRTSLIVSLAHIREHDARYEAIVSNSSDSIFTINNENRIIYANPAACQHLSLSIDADIGETHELGFTQDMGFLMEQAVQSVLTDGVTQELFIDRRHPTTQEVQSFEIQFTPNKSLDDKNVSVIGIARDVTMRKKTESILRVAFQHLPMLMTISDIETGRYIEVNDRFTELTGYSRNQAIGRSSIELGFIAKEDRDRMLSAIVEVGFIENMELQLSRIDGSTMTCIYSGETIEVGGSQALLSIAYDITEQKRVLAERESMERQLQQAIKMEAIGTLAGGIAHDFNNILSAILGYGQLALEQTTPESTIHQDLEQVIQAGTRASGLVQQILTFSRQGREEFCPIRLQPLIKEVAKLLRSTMPTTIDLRLEIDETCGAILGDSVQLHQVLMNLCTNARQAIGNEHGVIDIALHVAPMSTPLYSVENKPLKEGIYLELKVSDTGIGMSPEVLTRIFDPFFTTRELEQGTGLGLAVTHGIITKHQGAITVDSALGVGTTFHVYLPVAVAQGETTDTGNAEENLCGHERILLVDDEPMLVAIIERSLSRLGYTVSSFSNSMEALNFFLSYPDEIDLLVTDMTMPGMTGLAISREMCKVRPELQVILCTGYSDAISEETATAEGIDVFIRKPVVGKDIARAIRTLQKV